MITLYVFKMFLNSNVPGTLSIFSSVPKPSMICVRGVHEEPLVKFAPGMPGP